MALCLVWAVFALLAWLIGAPARWATGAAEWAVDKIVELGV